MAMSVLLVFMSVSLMHAFVSHEHPHESFASELGLPVHNVAGEKYFLLLLLASLFIVRPLVVTAKDFFLAHVLAGSPQTPHNIPLPIYTRLFAKGILHSKAY